MFVLAIRCTIVACAWAEHLSAPLLTMEYVLVETVNALSCRMDREQAPASGQMVRSEQDCLFAGASDVLFRAGLEWHRQQKDKESSLTDCISFVVMRHHGITQALAYEHHFEQAGDDARLHREP